MSSTSDRKPSSAAAETENEHELSIGRSSLRPGNVWLFFDEIPDVNDLSPAEEQEEPWEATIDGDRIGMAVVDTMPSDHVYVSRLAVKESARENGVGTAILDRLVEEYGHVTCHVHETNSSGEAVVTAAGFQEVEETWFYRLDRYEHRPDDEGADTSNAN